MKRNNIINSVAGSLAFVAWTVATGCSSALTDEPLQSILPPTAESISSRYLTPTQAGEIAAGFMESLGSGPASTRTSSHSVASVSLMGALTKTRASEADTTFYVVNFKDGGYSVVAAEKDLENHVYVYSETGTVTYPMHPVMEDYLVKVAEEIPTAPKRNSSGNSTNGIARKPTNPDTLVLAEGIVEIFGVRYITRAGSSHNSKGPLVKTKWGQEDPYNYFCPSIYGGTKALAGCVPVAIGQICGYHNWPTQLDGYTFNWNEMLSTPTKADITDSGAYDTAKLLRILGDKSKVIYGILESGTTTENAIECLKEIGYPNVKIVSYSTSICLSHLTNYGPLYMRGNLNEDCINSPIPFEHEGHAWVVDGYDSCSYYIDYYREDNGEFFRRDYGDGYTYLHFNLGWDGNGDGFYLMSGAGTSANQNKFSEFEYNKENYLITDIKK